MQIHEMNMILILFAIHEYGSLSPIILAVKINPIYSGISNVISMKNKKVYIRTFTLTTVCAVTGVAYLSSDLLSAGYT